MNSLFLQRSRRSWAMALVLALLLLTGWGQVHRVLHPGATVQASASTTSKGKLVAAAWVDEDGSSLCQLLDHLSQGAGPLQVVVLPMASMPSAVPQVVQADRGSAHTVRSFDARGPPPLA